eukprot:351639-Chlamydomonas_euryale.AAC.8
MPAYGGWHEQGAVHCKGPLPSHSGASLCGGRTRPFGVGWPWRAARLRIQLGRATLIPRSASYPCATILPVLPVLPMMRICPSCPSCPLAYIIHMHICTCCTCAHLHTSSHLHASHVSIHHTSAHLGGLHTCPSHAPLYISANFSLASRPVSPCLPYYLRPCRAGPRRTEGKVPRVPVHLYFPSHGFICLDKACDSGNV